MLTKHFDRLDANDRDLFVASMRWAENHWDEAMDLLWASNDARLVARHHEIRGSVWYAFGLLMRNDPGDVARPRFSRHILSRARGTVSARQCYNLARL